MKVPHRDSLISATAHSLREAICKNEIKGFLPGVRKLSQELKVSIPTILGAIHLLESEGFLELQQGKRTKIRKITAPRRAKKQAPHSVILLSFSHVWNYQSVLLELTKLGVNVHAYDCIQTNRSALLREVRRLTEAESPDCWVLMGPPEEVQHFFAEQKIPCVMNGKAVPRFPWPDFELDFNALYRHSVGHLQRCGHRRICLLTTQYSAERNEESLQVFRDAVMEKLPHEAKWQAVHTHEGSAEEFLRLLKGLFLHRKHIPTALVVAMSYHLAYTMTWLAKQGLRIPEDVSLISRDHDELLEHLYPRPAYYIRPASISNRFVRVIYSFLEKKHLRLHNRIVPEFVSGDSIAKVAAIESSLEVRNEIHK